jgi:hypothetical protein
MMFLDAQRTVARFLSPLPLDEFLDSTLQGGFCRISTVAGTDRTELLGPDPAQRLLAAHHLAPLLTYHSANPAGPAPSLKDVLSAEDFASRIEQLHRRNYSVRFPSLRPLSPPLDHLARALEAMLHTPVTASAFWSRGGMRAPVHCDDHDILAVQLRGVKRWYVSRRPSELPNTWARIPSGPPELGDHDSFVLEPGDLVWLPRGTFHTVDSDTDSIHVSIGFTPLTVREALVAALDHLSDIDPRLRTTLGGRLAFQLRGTGFEQLEAPVQQGLVQLVAACRTPGFLGVALQRRSARAIATLDAPAPPVQGAPIHLDTVLVQVDTALCHLTCDAKTIDLSYPGGHVYIHLGAQEGLVYMINTPRFRLREVPGGLTDEVRLSLAAKLVEIGYLRIGK